jgi:hypothetical protein
MVVGIVPEAAAETGGVNRTPKVSVHDVQRPQQIWQKMWRTQSAAQRDIVPNRSRSIGKQSASCRFFSRSARLAGGKAETKTTDVMGLVARCPVDPGF